MRFLRLDLFPKKRKVISKNTRRTYLTPKQILFLNIYKNRIKGTKNKPNFIKGDFIKLNTVNLVAG
jgi:hypothetical protein